MFVSIDFLVFFARRIMMRKEYLFKNRVIVETKTHLLKKIMDMIFQVEITVIIAVLKIFCILFRIKSLKMLGWI